MNNEILLKISKAVAAAMNAGDLRNIAAELAAIIPATATPADRAALLDNAIVYLLYAAQPGYPDDGRPGCLPADTNLKEAVLHEIDVMIEADFDKSGHLSVWRSIRKTVAATPEQDFQAGVAVNCPDDYLLNLDRQTCAEVLRQHGVMPAWAS